MESASLDRLTHQYAELTPGLAYAESLLAASKKTETAQRIIRKARTTIELKATYFTQEPEDLNIPASADIAPNFKECLWLLFWVGLTAFAGTALWGLT